MASKKQANMNQFEQQNEAAQALAVPNHESQGVQLREDEPQPSLGAQVAEETLAALETEPERQPKAAEVTDEDLSHADEVQSSIAVNTHTYLSAEKQTLVTDLPDEVKNALSGYDNYALEEFILKSLNLYPAAITVDRLIITLWTKHQIKADRAKVLSRLRALSVAGHAAKLDGSRSQYRITTAGQNFLSS